MPLTSCPECQGKVSGHAAACPHCGHPMQANRRNAQERSKHILRAALVLCVIGVLWSVENLFGGQQGHLGTSAYVLALAIAGVTLASAKLYLIKQAEERAHRSL